ncbi:Oidioi.mRNA.OKI2018_I69.chr2.g5183.t1.cds [Oikopleura dioica]|uniref:Oidioi.mRNA.OKI2018_I69.chr2.g5183.t1.cds n=1 Tax=Oikopleura dioica TaxID=34765 RepID=A0ABN7T8S4_OIKDI|nr:Oidioi.mRNA.OKI2018_I69.chr2.g5183.t1.cds [Oikopleura dioica]
MIKSLKIFLSLFLPTEPFSLGILDGSAAYNFDQYRGKTFDGFIRHSNNPNYVRLANKDMSQYRLITEGEWERMDNTQWNNNQNRQGEEIQENQPVVEFIESEIPTTIIPIVTTRARLDCSTIQPDVYPECSGWIKKCHVKDIFISCPSTCSGC